LLRAGNVRRDLHCERRTSAILFWPKTRRFFIENRSEFRRVSAADGEENRFAYLTRQRIALGIIEEAPNKAQIRLIREKLTLIILFAEDELGLFSIFVRRNSYGVTFV
jgi:hypothetical protein